jgi:CRISPR-associated protein Cst1
MNSHLEYLIDISDKNDFILDNLDIINKSVDYVKGKLKNKAYKYLDNIIDSKKLKKLTKKNVQIDVDTLKIFKDSINQNKYEIVKSECFGNYDQKSKKSSPSGIVDKYINTNMVDFNKSVEEIKEYFELDKSNYNFNCFSCDKEIKSIEKGLSFVLNTYFDTSRKTSHIWNFESDIEFCPICKLVYYCIPAGFSTVYTKGIFVNDNHNVKDLVNLNFKVRMGIIKDSELNDNTTFKSIITALTEEVNEDYKYEVADIQVIRYENNKYRFNVLSKNILKVIRDSKNDLNSLVKACYIDKENDKSNFRIYEELIKKLFNAEHQFLLIHKLFVLLITKEDNCYYNINSINRVIRINFNFLKGVGYMADKEKDVLKSYRGAGYYLRQEYKKKGSDKKLEGISYKLLNSLKTNNNGMFMDVIINSYLYAGQQIPSFFTDCLKSNVELKTIGYAFVSGLVDGEDYKKNNEGGNN